MDEPSDPNAAIAAALARIADRLDRLEGRLDGIERAAREGVGAVGIATDTFDRLAAQVGEEQVDARLRTLADALLPLTDPAVVRALVQLAGHAPALAELAAAAPGAVAMVTDTVDGWAARLQAQGIDVDERGRLLLEAMERLTSPSAVTTLDAVFTRIGTIEHLLRSPVLSPTSVDVVSQAADALVETRAQGITPLGFFALLGAMGEPEVQRAVGFAIQFARAFGRRLSAPS